VFLGAALYQCDPARQHGAITGKNAFDELIGIRKIAH
jgi:hypothetical protein